MDNKILFRRVAWLIFFIFFMNFLAGKFYWYTSIWYFDIVMHILGGIFIGLLLFWFLNKKKITFNLIFALKAILGVLIVGILWEFFEIILNNIIAGDNFNIFDTISDLFFDLAGGSLASIYFLRKIIINKQENKL